MEDNETYGFVRLCCDCKIGTHKPWDSKDIFSCRSKDAPYTDFVDGIKDPHVINCGGKCKFYEEKF